MRYIFIIIFSVFSAQLKAQDNNLSKLKLDFELAIVNSDEALIKTLAKQLKPNYSKYKLIYYKELLNSLPSKSVLITNGKDDTFPIIITQVINGINPTVDVISLNLLNKYPKYVEDTFSKYNVSSSFDKTSSVIYLTRILQQSKAKTFIASTVNPSVYTKHSKHLFLVGLSLEYKSMHQYKKLQEFYKASDFLIDLVPYLTTEKMLFSNYLAPLLTYYKLNQEGNGEKDKRLKPIIEALANYFGKTIPVTKIIKSYTK